MQSFTPKCVLRGRQLALVRPKPPGRPGLVDQLYKRRHLNGAHSRFRPLVASFRTRAFDGLLDGVYRQDAEDDGDAGLERRTQNPARHHVADHVVVARRPANHRAQRHHSVVMTALGEFFSRQRDLYCARYPDDGEVFG